MGVWKNCLILWEDYMWNLAKKEFPDQWENTSFKEAYGSEMIGGCLADYEDLPILEKNFAGQIRSAMLKALKPEDCDLTPAFNKENVKIICADGSLMAQDELKSS